MAKQRWLATGGMFLILTLGSFLAFAETEAPRDASSISFEGKIVWIVLRNTNMMQNNPPSEILKDAAIREIGGRAFLVGVSQPRPWDGEGVEPNCQVGVAWDCVQQFYAYTPEQFEIVQKKWQADEGQ